jgi:syntaxin 8
MRDLLGGEGKVESLDPVVEELSAPSPPPVIPTPPPQPPAKDAEPFYTPYTDDPEAGYEPGIMLQTQRRMIDEQDEQLDRLSHSINRQHHISLQINDELDVHAGLLEELDTDLDRTESRMTIARRRLDRVAKGAKENGSTVTIGVLILVLLILIIIFKT